MSINTQISQNGKELIIAIQGRFDFTTLQNFRHAYETVEFNPDAYIVDLKGSDYLDSSALGMLLSLRDFAGGDTAKIKILNCNSTIKRLLTITKLNELFKVE